jgi:hypothetical protein
MLPVEIFSNLQTGTPETPEGLDKYRWNKNSMEGMKVQNNEHRRPNEHWKVKV